MNRQLSFIIGCLLVVFGLTARTPRQAQLQAAAVTIPASTTVTSSERTVSQVSPDAIAVMVFDNNQNLSPRDWYKQNIGAQRSLQSLAVDGYEAIRDDRTVYVAAANIDRCPNLSSGSAASSDCLKPIIVIISFNQNISNETVDIFGQILSNWRFNQDINGQPGVCSGTASLSCLTNSDCPSGQTCGSLKARIVRDTKRLMDINAMRGKLEQYRQSYQHYPSLETGTYLANKTLSVWPSWQKTLSVKLGSSLPLDPINKIGACSGNFNPATCWDEQQRSFATAWPILPANSRAYQYEFINNTRYKLCANFETNYQNILSYSCDGNHENRGPIIVCPTMRGSAGRPFTGYADIFDNEGDQIDSHITYTDTYPAGTNLMSKWKNLTVKLIDNRQRIEIKTSQTSSDGRYDITLEAKDNLGASTKQNCTVIIGNGLCGNDQLDSGEDCENGLGIATEAHGSSPDNQYSCNQYCHFAGGWCGDNTIQNGQNFTLNREQCDGLTGIASKTNNSNINRQYSCAPSSDTNACKFNNSGYCGDHTIQISTNKNINEQCDRSATSSNPTPAETYAGIQRYQCGQPGTANACKFTGGYCGDSTVDSGYGEDCETSVYLIPAPAFSSANKQYGCVTSTCQFTGGYCGDSSIQDSVGENCDCGNGSKSCAWAGNSLNPNQSAASTADNLNGCKNCVQSDGYCGDGIVQSQYETCDPEEPLSVFKSRIGNNKINQAYYNDFKTACLTQKCHITCYDKDNDNYGLNKYTSTCAKPTIDCEDRPTGEDGLLNSADDGSQINPSQPDDCTQYDGIDNNCNGRVDDNGWLSGNPIMSDNFTTQQTGLVFTDQDYTNVALDTTTGYADNSSVRLEQFSQRQGGNYVWPNTCTNFNSDTSACAPYGPNKSLVGLTWDISHLALNINQDYVIRFNYKGSANFLHPTAATTGINPANQVAWSLGTNSILTPAAISTSSNNLIKPGNYTNFNNAFGHFSYYQDLTSKTAGNLSLSIIMGRNNLSADGNVLNIDNITVTSCNNVRPDGTYCGNGIIEGTYENCDINLASSWDKTTEFCDDTCHIGNKLRILQVYPKDVDLSLASAVNLQRIISEHNDNYVSRTATVAAVSLTDFNNNPTSYIPSSNPTSQYNTIVFGFSDCNDGQDLSAAGRQAMASFITAEGGVIFGHDTFWSATDDTCGRIHPNFNSLAGYAGINIGTYAGSMFDNRYSSTKKNPNLPVDATMYSKPYIIPNSFPNLTTHISGAIATASLCSAADGLKIWYIPSSSPTVSLNNFWATTCGRVEHIALGHTVGMPYINEQRALVNMLYYVATH